MTDHRVPLGRSFWWFLSARIVSEIGDRALIVILPFVAISLHADSFGVAALLVASQLPLVVGLFLMSSFGGQVPRQRSLVVSDALRAAIQTTVFLLLIAGRATLAVVVVAQAIAAFISAVAVPVSEASVADLVPRSSRQRANAALQSGRSVVRILAPGVAGALAGLISIDVLYLLDALTFVVSAIVLAALTFPVRAPRTAADRMPRTGRFAAKAIRSHRWLVFGSIGSAAVNALTVAPVLVLGPLVVADGSGGAAAWGVVMAAFGVGGTVGAILLWRRTIHHPLRVAFLVAPMVSVLPLCLAAELSLPWLCVAAFVTGCQATVFNVAGETARQNKLDSELRVQGSAFASLLSFSLTPVGLTAAGAAAVALDESSVLYAAAFFGVAIPILVLADRDVWHLSIADDRSSSVPREV